MKTGIPVCARLDARIASGIDLLPEEELCVAFARRRVSKLSEHSFAYLPLS